MKTFFIGVHLISGKNTSITRTELHNFHWSLVKAAKVSPNAKFYNLSTGYWVHYFFAIISPTYQYSEVESRTQGSRPRPRTQKKSEAKALAKDSLSEDRHSRGQGQECSRPRPRTKDTSASALQKKKKVFTKIFQAISTKNVFQKFFQALHKILTIQKIVLSSRRGQANFWGLSQGQGLDLRGQGQGLQNLSSRTSSRPRTSSRTPPLPILLPTTHLPVTCSPSFRQSD